MSAKKLKISDEVWMNTQSEIESFMAKLEEELSEYCGFQMKFPLRTEGNEIKMDVETKFSVSVPGLTEEIALTILDPLSKILEKSINESEKIDIKNILVFTRDISLSYIFSDYCDMTDSEQYNIIKTIEELKDIGEKTYESQCVDIGVIYCMDDKMLKEIENLNTDIILIPVRKSIKKFFLEEKPLLRLIDNKSLAIAIDKNYNVFAIIRKKPGSKSLSYLLKAQYNQWSINDIKKIIFDFIAEILKEFIDKLPFDDHKQQNKIEQYQSKLFKIAERIQKKKCPEYIYFSIQNKEINIYTNQKFVISYYNGNWKLKHYNLMLGALMILIFTRILDQLLLQKLPEFENEIENLTKGILNLFDILISLSQSGKSSIFVVILKKNFANKLSSSEAGEKLKENGFENNNSNHNFLSVIHYDGYQVNIKDSDLYLVEAVSSIDGAVILDPYLNIISFGEIIHVPSDKVYDDTFGTGTKAARYISSLGVVFKISEDGDIKIFMNEKLLLKI